MQFNHTIWGPLAFQSCRCNWAWKMSHSFEWHPQHDALHRSRGVHAPRSPSLNLCGTCMESTGNPQGIPVCTWKCSVSETLRCPNTAKHSKTQSSQAVHGPPRNFPPDTRSSEERWVPSPGDFSLDTTQILGEIVRPISQFKANGQHTLTMTINACGTWHALGWD